VFLDTEATWVFDIIDWFLILHGLVIIDDHSMFAFDIIDKIGQGHGWKLKCAKPRLNTRIIILFSLKNCKNQK